MMDKGVLNILIIYIFFSFIFSNNNILWDFGVVINQIEKDKDSIQNTSKYLNRLEKSNIDINAYISNPFIVPTENNYYKFYKDKINNQIEENYNIKISSNNIYEIKLKIEKLYFSQRYNKIIKILRNNNFSEISEQNKQYLQYYLANSLYKIGDYDNAITLINSLEKTEENHILLIMIYESMGNKKTVKEQYINFIELYPHSEYLNLAKIKINMLNKQL